MNSWTDQQKMDDQNPWNPKFQTKKQHNVQGNLEVTIRPAKKKHNSHVLQNISICPNWECYKNWNNLRGILWLRRTKKSKQGYSSGTVTLPSQECYLQNQHDITQCGPATPGILWVNSNLRVPNWKDDWDNKKFSTKKHKKHIFQLRFTWWMMYLK